MGADSKIEWTHHTFNPWRGCTKATWVDATGKAQLHPGCLNCYAEVDYSVKMHGIKWGRGQERRPKAESGWAEPFAWARTAAKAGKRHRVFCASLADVLDDEVPDAMRVRLWDAIRGTASICGECGAQEVHHVQRGYCAGKRHGGPRRLGGLDWLVLTKRPENWGWVPTEVRPLVWLGTSVSDQETADEWVPRLLAADGFRLRFLSVEPLLGPVDLSRWFYAGHHPSWDGSPGRRPIPRISWVIVGGESGPKARPCNVEWVRDIVRQCREAGVPCFVKQMGSVWADENRAMTWVDKNGGRVQVPDHKGGDWSEWPEDLRVRQFPETP